MAQAAASPTTTRRAMLTGAGAILALPSTAALAVHGDDTALIALGRQLDAAQANVDRVYAKWRGQPFSEQQERETEEAQDGCSSIVDQIEDMQAHTLRGLQVKGSAILWCWCGELDSLIGLDNDTTDKRIIKSALRDLLAMASA